MAILCMLCARVCMPVLLVVWVTSVVIALYMHPSIHLLALCQNCRASLVCDRGRDYRSPLFTKMYCFTEEVYYEIHEQKSLTQYN